MLVIYLDKVVNLLEENGFEWTSEIEKAKKIS